MEERDSLKKQIEELKTAAPPPPLTDTLPHPVVDSDHHGLGKCVPLALVTAKLNEVDAGYTKDIIEMEQQIADVLEKSHKALEEKIIELQQTEAYLLEELDKS